MVSCGVKAQSIFALAMLAAALAAQPSATAQEVSIDTTALERVFRQSSRGAVMPVGPMFTQYFGPTHVASETPATCSMQVLTAYERDPESLAYLTLSTHFRFLSRNDGTNSQALSWDAIAAQCDQLNPLFGWFSADAHANTDAVIFAAWHASGVLQAIGAQDAQYQGFDLSRYPDRPTSPDRWPSQTVMRRDLEEYARRSGHAPSFVWIQQSGESIEATVRFGGGGLGGSMLVVTLMFTEAYSRQTHVTDRRLTGIEIGPVLTYVV